MGDANAAQHHMIANPEWMDIEPEARAYIGQKRELHCLAALEILVARDLHVLCFTRESVDFYARPFCERRIVREILFSGRLRPAMRVENDLEIKNLRRLDSAQLRPIDC